MARKKPIVKPYKDEIKEGFVERIFSEDIDEVELMWHRDGEDREVEVIGETDWMIQIDNELPKVLEGKIHIPEGVYHRVIKGSGDLKIKIIK